MKKSTVGIAALSTGVTLGVVVAMYGPLVLQHKPSQPYAGQDVRQISSLSADDVADLEKGSGWGLAKPAELNGYPGPSHVLEFADKLELNSTQKTAVEGAFTAMQLKAKELGAALITAESALDEAFKNRSVTPTVLTERIASTEEIRAALRYVHLAAHLEVTPLLTEEQKTQYAALRGYGDGQDGHEGH